MSPDFQYSKLRKDRARWQTKFSLLDHESRELRDLFEKAHKFMFLMANDVLYFQRISGVTKEPFGALGIRVPIFKRKVDPLQWMKLEIS